MAAIVFVSSLWGASALCSKGPWADRVSVEVARTPRELWRCAGLLDAEMQGAGSAAGQAFFALALGAPMMFRSSHTRAVWDPVVGYVDAGDGSTLGVVQLMRAVLRAPRRNEDRKVFTVHNLLVTAAARRQGLGVLLLEWCKVRVGPGAAIVVAVREDNAPARGLYEKLGFAQVGGPYGALSAVISKRLSPVQVAHAKVLYRWPAD